MGDVPIEGMSHLVLGPGPGAPSARDMRILQHYLGKVPILGICLGHQTIGAALGAKIIRAKEPRHGKIELITHDQQGLFQGLETPLWATRYHSLVIDPQTLPPSLEVTALSAGNEIMGVRHKDYLVEGVQFHPEAIATSQSALFNSFLHSKILRKSSEDNVSMFDSSIQPLSSISNL